MGVLVGAVLTRGDFLAARLTQAGNRLGYERHPLCSVTGTFLGCLEIALGTKKIILFGVPTKRIVAFTERSKMVDNVS